MEATRVRLSSLVEWLLAAAIMAGALLVAGISVQEFRSVQAVTPVIAGEAPPAEAPQAVPPGAVSVPILLLADGTHIRVGDSQSAVLRRLGAEAQIGPDAVERRGSDERVTRFYGRAGSRFVLVLEPTAPGGEPRVSGIYLP